MTYCRHIGCKRKANFNIKGEQPILCFKHKTDIMINVNTNICEYMSCIKVAIYGYEGKIVQFCASHKIVGMKSNRYKKCSHDGCTTRPSHNIEGKPPIVCSKHKSDNMINVVSKTRCIHKGCTVLNPLFDYKGGKGRYCVTHKEPDMVDVKHKRCEQDGCDLQPSYDIKGGKGRFCTTHKMPDMIDIKNHYCEYIGCTVVCPIFNKKGSKKGKYCVTHKDDDMIDVKHKTCEYTQCTVRATFDIKGGNGRFCVNHMQVNMVNISHRCCQHTDCTVRPNFDIKGGSGKYCATHKENNMIDIANKYCIVDNCNVRVRYGNPGHKMSHCTAHREKGMIRNSTAKCIECKDIAIWGKNTIPTHCELHKTPDQHNLVEQQCSSCGLLYILNNNMCEHCNPVSFNKTILLKQKSLMTYLDSRGLNGNTTDRIIDRGQCGMERPDRVYDFGNKIIILECDEHQHRDRMCLCEQTRMINIGQSFGGIPVYFIRFNPDRYISKHTEIQEEHISKRYKLCGDLIQDIKIERITLPLSLVSSIYLYFDGWSSIDQEKWNIITPFQ